MLRPPRLHPRPRRRGFTRKLDKFNASIVEIIKQPDVQAKIIELGAVPVPETSAEFGAFIAAETLKWAKVIKEANIGMD